MQSYGKSDREARENRPLAPIPVPSFKIESKRDPVLSLPS